MKNKLHLSLLALGFAAASLSSCSRASYSFNNKMPAYLGTASAPSVAVVPSITTSYPAASASAKTVAQPQLAEKKSQLTPVASTALGIPSIKKSKIAKPSLIQRVMLNKLAKQIAKVQPKQAMAGTEHTAASKAGRAGLVILAGAVIILIGGLIGGANIVVTIGGIVFVIGLILLVIALVGN